MPNQERRKHPRIGSLNLLSFLVLDEKEQIVTQGVGRTLNVSEEGILLETHTPIDLEHTVSLFIALEDDLVDVKGRIVHVEEGTEGTFNTGIAFLETPEPAGTILKRFVQAFQAGRP